MNGEENKPIKEPEISRQHVSDCLRKIKEQGLFHKLKSEQANGYFDPDKGRVDENEERQTKEILSEYRNSLIKRENVATKAFFSDEKQIQDMIDALEPGSFSRKVLLAYWRVDEEIDWGQTSGNISTIQRFTAEEFPTYQDTEDVSNTLKDLNSQE